MKTTLQAVDALEYVPKSYIPKEYRIYQKAFHFIFFNFLRNKNITIMVKRLIYLTFLLCVSNYSAPPTNSVGVA